MLDNLISYGLGFLMLICPVVGGIAAGCWLANRKRENALWLALASLAAEPALAWLYARELSRSLGQTEPPLAAMFLLALVPSPVFFVWGFAAFFGARRANLRWPGKSALWVFSVLGLVVTGLSIYSFLFPTYHSYGFIRE